MTYESLMVVGWRPIFTLVGRKSTPGRLWSVSITSIRYDLYDDMISKINLRPEKCVNYINRINKLDGQECVTITCRDQQGHLPVYQNSNYSFRDTFLNRKKLSVLKEID